MLQNMHTRFALPHLISIARPKKGIYASINQQLNCRLLKSQLIHWVIAGLILSDLTDNFTWIEDIIDRYCIPIHKYSVWTDCWPIPNECFSIVTHFASAKNVRSRLDS